MGSDVDSRVLKYVERCSGRRHDGEAWIGFAETSKSGRTIYFNGQAFLLATGGRSPGNAHDIETWEPYWISGVKKRGTNRHWAGSGRISVSEDAVSSLLAHTGAAELDRSAYDVVESFPRADKEHFRRLSNASPYDERDED